MSGAVEAANTDHELDGAGNFVFEDIRENNNLRAETQTPRARSPPKILQVICCICDNFRCY